MTTNLNFENIAIMTLPIDPNIENSPRRVSGACFSLVSPTPIQNPKLILYSTEMANLLGIDNVNDLIEYLAGNKLFEGSRPYAHCYAGHQFGYFSGQLGDGRAITLGQVLTPNQGRWELQLKGAGLTPYSRQFDGRALLRSSLREFLCCEAMAKLGIPTTRALSCITSDTWCWRDKVREPCAVVCRLAHTFFRFGSFEIFVATNSQQGPSLGLDAQMLPQMLNFIIHYYYPEISPDLNPLSKYETFFRLLVQRSANLVAGWQSVGFCHGVLNTDNMSITGLTLDYGPYRFSGTF